MVDTTRHVCHVPQLSVAPRRVAATTGLSAGAPRGAGPFGGAANELDEHSQPVGIARTRAPIERFAAERRFAGAGA
jgi:hypothetical protein